LWAKGLVAEVEDQEERPVREGSRLEERVMRALPGLLGLSDGRTPLRAKHLFRGSVPYRPALTRTELLQIREALR